MNIAVQSLEQAMLSRVIRMSMVLQLIVIVLQWCLLRDVHVHPPDGRSFVWHCSGHALDNSPLIPEKLKLWHAFSR